MSEIRKEQAQGVVGIKRSHTPLEEQAIGAIVINSIEEDDGGTISLENHFELTLSYPVISYI